MDWLDWCQKDDITTWKGRRRGNGPFGSNGPFLGVILHVNVSGKTSNGTSVDYFENNPGLVFPNFQVYKDGSVVQFAPLNWQPWCQVDGNDQYAAIETGGDPDEPLTSEQMTSIATILRAYKSEMGLALQVANAPGQKGLGTHQMGGAAWGGHACPGDIRAGQRSALLVMAADVGDSFKVDGVELTKDELLSIIDDEVVAGLKSALNGTPRSGEFTHTNHPEVFPGSTDMAVYPRLADLDGKTIGQGSS